MWSWKAKASLWTLLAADVALIPLVPWSATTAASTFVAFRPIVMAMQQQAVAVASLGQ